MRYLFLLITICVIVAVSLLIDDIIIPSIEYKKLDKQIEQNKKEERGEK